MKRLVPINLLVIVTVLILSAIVPSAQAQIRFGGPARTTLMPMPAALKDAGPIGEPLALPSIESLELAAPFQSVTTTNLFSQIAFGAGWTTVFSFVNTGAATAAGNLILNDDNGQPLRAAFTSPGSFSTIDFSYPLSVPSGGIQEVTAGPISPLTDPTKTGWARVEASSGSFGGVATFEYAPGGVLSIIVGVLSASATSAATIPVDDNHAAQVDTGYAIANPGNTPLNIKLIFVNPDGTIQQSVTSTLLNPLAPRAHIARYFWQDANNTSFVFRGSVVLIEQAGQPFSVVALVSNHGLLTAIPAIAGSGPNIR